MNKESVIQSMKDDNKVTHKMFCSDEFVYMKDSIIYDENDYTMHDFWGLRTDAIWEKGWSIFLGN